MEIQVWLIAPESQLSPLQCRASALSSKITKTCLSHASPLHSYITVTIPLGYQLRLRYRLTMYRLTHKMPKSHLTAVSATMGFGSDPLTAELAFSQVILYLF